MSDVNDLGWSIDHDGPVPPYEQVKQCVVDGVDSGALPPGRKLPPVRTLASQLGVAANTVARAYKELEAQGVVATRGRAGTIVLGAGTDRAAREAAAAYASAVRTLGLSADEALALVRRALEV